MASNNEFRQNLERLISTPKPTLLPKPSITPKTIVASTSRQTEVEAAPSAAPNPIHKPPNPIVAVSHRDTSPIQVAQDDQYEYYYEDSTFCCGLCTKKKVPNLPKTDSQNTNFYVALFDYKKRSRLDLDFKKGDLFRKLSEQNDVPNDWINMFLLQGGQKGLVPKQYVAQHGSLEAQNWFFGKCSHTQAEEFLMHKKNPIGAFLVRFSEKDPKNYTLSVKILNPSENQREVGVGVKHLRVRFNTKTQQYFMKTTVAFDNLEELVEYYQMNSLIKTGCTSRLKVPCNKTPPVIDLSPEMCDNWEISKQELKFGKKIGSGQFGQVWLGKWKDTVEVAIKELKSNCAMTKEEFLKEATTMKTFRHENLVKLYCICNERNALYIVTEYMKCGSLLDHLRSNKNKKTIDYDTLHYFAAQIAAGMSYLEENNLVHRDLAARNVLIGQCNIAKVADFGLAAQVKPGAMITQNLNLAPIRWMAPESIRHGQYSIKSDVFSFGVVLFEIYTFGEKPWPGKTNEQVKDAVAMDETMSKSAEVADEIYNVMVDCWNRKSYNRPTFAALKELFDAFKMNLNQYVE